VERGGRKDLARNGRIPHLLGKQIGTFVDHLGRGRRLRHFFVKGSWIALRHCRWQHSRWGARGFDARRGRGLGIGSAAPRKRNADAAGGRWVAPDLREDPTVAWPDISRIRRWVAPTQRADPVVAWPDIPRAALVGFTLLYKCLKTLQMRHYAPQSTTVRGGRRAFEGETQIGVAQEDRGSWGGRSGGSNTPWRPTLRSATVRHGFCSLGMLLGAGMSGWLMIISNPSLTLN
jgi:hypothetical protein